MRVETDLPPVIFGGLLRQITLQRITIEAKAADVEWTVEDDESFKIDLAHEDVHRGLVNTVEVLRVVLKKDIVINLITGGRR